MSPTDALFLLGESPQRPMHGGGLVLLSPPDGADADDVRALLDAARQQGDVAPELRTRPARSLTTLGQWGWDTDVSCSAPFVGR